MNSAKRDRGFVPLLPLHCRGGHWICRQLSQTDSAATREHMDRTYRVVSSYCRSLHVPWPELGTLARARLDGLSRSDQFSGSSSGRHPLDPLRLDCLVLFRPDARRYFTPLKPDYE
jgi:hypothetical protein